MSILHRLAAAGTALSAAAVLLAAPAVGDPPGEVDESLLVPTTLDSSFAFTCRERPTGPVCTGDRHIDTGWAPLDLPCHVPLHGRYVSDRYTTRYYDQDYLGYYRTFRTDDVDQLSTSPGGPATGTIESRTRFAETYAVPGDDSTFTIVTTGTIWDIRTLGRPSIFRAVGTLVEPPGEAGTFTGQVFRDGVPTRYEDAPLDVVLPEQDFFDFVCRAATGT
ncbi:hypothetical protein EUA06_01450 [Nocardioides glacieisoli]|uniref:Uncharacterized protein n=1 Tax=Nocardioides glacieisoli TaxID=1168730 RepID=A0A4Q2S721_9ACTN|nr:hypothetical protein [Nocardioides glacieisoli]RYB96275.1 hypothetical protein EUA06_01450 [Nocardioides glacieisoli]